MKSGKAMILAAALALPVFVLGGCPKKEDKKPAEKAAPAAKQGMTEPAPAPLSMETPPQPEKPPEDKPHPLKDIMTPLCDRMLAEYKVAHQGQTITENLEKSIIADCRVQAMSYEGSSKAAEATAAYADYLTQACLTKKAQEWIDCFNKEQPAAGSAANKILLGK